MPDMESLRLFLFCSYLINLFQCVSSCGKVCSSTNIFVCLCTKISGVPGSRVGTGWLGATGQIIFLLWKRLVNNFCLQEFRMNTFATGFVCCPLSVISRKPRSDSRVAWRFQENPCVLMKIQDEVSVKKKGKLGQMFLKRDLQLGHDNCCIPDQGLSRESLGTFRVFSNSLGSISKPKYELFSTEIQSLLKECLMGR